MLLYADSSLVAPERPGAPGGDAAPAADGLWGNLSRAVGLGGGAAAAGGGGAGGGWRPSPVKATDFGLSIRHRPDDPPLKSRSGTPAYMAPEVIRQVGAVGVGVGVGGGGRV
jgi:serine/threonine protein kinase